DEQVLLTGSAFRSFPIWALTLVPAALALFWWGGLAAIGVLALVALGSLLVLPLGNYTLLPDRLFFQPIWGAPRQIRLAELGAGSILLGPREAGLKIDGKGG